MAARQGNGFDNVYHLESIDGKAFKVKNSDTVCANRTKSDHSDDTSRKESEFLVTYRDRIYNINNFLNYHPGGKNTLIHFKDRVLDRELAKNPHSKAAHYLLEEFAVQHQERYNECEVSNL